MNAITPAVASTEPNADILAEFEVDAGIVLQDEKKAAAFYAACAAEVDAHTPDLTTDTGRKAIASLAYRSNTRKAAIDKARLGLTEDWRKQTAAVNAAGKVAEAKLNDLAVKARKPLTDWEKAEADKRARAEAAFKYLQDAPVVLLNDTAATLEARLQAVRDYLLPNDFEPEHRDACERLRATAIAALTTAIAEAKQKEQDSRDLAAFRASQAAAAPPPAEVLAYPVNPLASPAQAFVAPAPAAPAPEPAPVTQDEALAALNRAATALVSTCGIDLKTARRVVTSIGRGEVPHLTFSPETRNVG